MTEENWVIIVEALNDTEAEIIKGLLESAGIPVKCRDANPYTGAMRVIGGLAYEINILVPEKFREHAQEVLRKATEDEQ